jgi:hypothetical protein
MKKTENDPVVRSKHLAAIALDPEAEPLAQLQRAIVPSLDDAGHASATQLLKGIREECFKRLPATPARVFRDDRRLDVPLSEIVVDDASDNLVVSSYPDGATRAKVIDCRSLADPQTYLSVVSEEQHGSGQILGNGDR